MGQYTKDFDYQALIEVLTQLIQAKLLTQQIVINSLEHLEKYFIKMTA